MHRLVSIGQDTSRDSSATKFLTDRAGGSASSRPIINIYKTIRKPRITLNFIFRAVLIIIISCFQCVRPAYSGFMVRTCSALRTLTSHIQYDRDDTLRTVMQSLICLIQSLT